MWESMSKAKGVPKIFFDEQPDEDRLFHTMESVVTVKKAVEENVKDHHEIVDKLLPRRPRFWLTHTPYGRDSFYCHARYIQRRRRTGASPVLPHVQGLQAILRPAAR